MLRRTQFKAFFPVFLTAMTLGAPVAHATLGENARSIEEDRRVLAAKARATGAATLSMATGYRVEELQTQTGSVREYVSASGQVFAVAWSGNVRPDLVALLGAAHYDDYASALRGAPRARGQRSMRVAIGRDVVVTHWGHMRGLRGLAYLPAALPDGVEPDELK